MADYVIGIDGGATRSQALALALDGSVLAEASGEALNEQAESAQCFRFSLQRLLDELTADLEGVCRSAVIGSASLFDEASVEECARLLGGIKHLPSNTLLCGDAATALHGATRGGPGILVIAGTGSIAIAEYADGKRRTVGGLGALLGGDPGSAFWMSCRAILEAETAPQPDSKMRLAVLNHFKVPTLPHLVGQPVRTIARLSAHLARAGAEDEAWANIETAAGQELAKLVWPLLRSDRTLPVFYAGSVLGHNQRVREAFAKTISNFAGSEIRPRAPSATATEGAAQMALKRSSIS